MKTNTSYLTSLIAITLLTLASLWSETSMAGTDSWYLRANLEPIIYDAFSIKSAETNRRAEVHHKINEKWLFGLAYEDYHSTLLSVDGSIFTFSLAESDKIRTQALGLETTYFPSGLADGRFHLKAEVAAGQMDLTFNDKSYRTSMITSTWSLGWVIWRMTDSFSLVAETGYRMIHRGATIDIPGTETSQSVGPSKVYNVQGGFKLGFQF